MKIILGGDVFLGGDLVDSEVALPINIPAFHTADIRIINLEQAVSDLGNAQDKCTLFTNSRSMKILQNLNVSIANIANNHIHDMGLEAIGETAEHIKSAGIAPLGAGETLEDARAPQWITDDLAILGYCEFGRSYLSKIALATQKSPGVSPLRIEQIYKDLDRLPSGKTAILYFHWGREHVLFPPRHDIDLARKLLEDDRVALIVGMHSHVIQGYISHNGKRAYMGIGNLLFPNFFMLPRTQIAYPQDRSVSFNTTRRYHAVYGLTYKKWRGRNRTSLLLEYNSSTQKINHHITQQDDNRPIVGVASKWTRQTTIFFVILLSQLYHLPKPIYLILEICNKWSVSLSWDFHNVIFTLRQKGFMFLFHKLYARIIGRSNA